MYNYFTFGLDHKNKYGESLSDYIVKVDGVNSEDCRARMFALVGSKFAFQYSEHEGKRLIEKYEYGVIDFPTFYKIMVWESGDSNGQDSGAYSKDKG